MTERFHPPLQAGQRFKLPADCGTGDTIFVVLRVTECSALVRALSAKHVVIPGAEPDDAPKADFWKGSAPKPISTRAAVILLEETNGTIPGEGEVEPRFKLLPSEPSQP